MKKLVILLLTTLLLTTTCFSQTISTQTNQDSIVYITSEQLKYTNLIFVEHDKLFNENILLNKQISNYQNKVDILEKSDSLRNVEVGVYKDLSSNYTSQIKALNKTIKNKKKTILGLEIGVVAISVAFLIYGLVK